MNESSTLKPRKRPVQKRAIAMVDAILDASARILVERGYAGLNTNAVAQRAGISIGSLYQYFPSKEALLVALQTRHAQDMSGALGSLLAESDTGGLASAVARFVRAAVAAHELDPALHRVLEKELPFFVESSELVGKDVHRHVLALLTKYRREVAQANLELAAWMVMRMTEALVHAAVLDKPAAFGAKEIETAVGGAIMAFLSSPAQQAGNG
ncbi:HTH-type transcriptional repressor KstR [Massilia sp. Bi118]|uniref:TetR/AcrR family transcriptional regulator n=1 Tax=Massilia sp. Bi118 TaxID=2822346 RepID=UPI001D98C495|nr:TetR/AcrR family transcriptional regulator [Massilia sp. Bi118]CAH0281419.1 HTH-type transcriptional repressor KstR [Massilia sp. Bi118]